MAKTRAEYIDRGRQRAQDEQASGRHALPAFVLKGQHSWQATAFWEGYDAEKARLAASPLAQEEKPSAGVPGASAAPSDGIRLECMPQNTAGWPRAAAEHARILAIRMNACKDPVLRRRLDRSLFRLQKRWA